MNKKINLAVAGAVLLASATAANAGIVIPAGDWTLDVNGNVNTYVTFQDHDNKGTVTGGLMDAYGTGDASNQDSNQSINTGLLPSWLGFTGTTRQNDIDVSFTISMQPNVSTNSSTGDGTGPLWRQAFLTFGDKSWGTVKMGKDIGIYAQDAILNDMTLLGVGGGFDNSGAATTTGGIGTGYIYAAWKGQVAYTTPNMNGFQATIGITNPNQAGLTLAGNTERQDSFGLEGKASYTFAGGPATGKVWAGFAEYTVTESTTVEFDISMYDAGVNVNVGNLGFVGYYYGGKGGGNGVLGYNGATATGQERDSDGGYVQATYTIPTGTKLGVAYGVTRLDETGTDGTGSTLVDEQNRWTVGAYHPLTKHLNLVAEYNQIEEESHAGITNSADAISLGAILFF